MTRTRSFLAATAALLLLSPPPRAEGGSGSLLPVRPLRIAGGQDLPLDAMPTDWDRAGGRAVLSSYSSGVYALRAERPRGRATVQHLLGPPEKGFLFGDARAGADHLWAIGLSRGLVRLSGSSASVIGPAQGLASSELLRVLVRANGEVWVAHVPVLNAKRGLVQILKSGSVAKSIELPSKEEGTITDWVDMPERGSVFASTMAGIVELRSDGTHERLTTSPMTALARGPGGIVGMVGGGVERWDGTRFHPVLFGVTDPRRAGTPLVAGPPLDIAIDPRGNWHILFEHRVLVTLNARGKVTRVLTANDGIPPSASRLLWNEGGGYLIIAGAEAGLYWVG